MGNPSKINNFFLLTIIDFNVDSEMGNWRACMVRLFMGGIVANYLPIR